MKRMANITVPIQVNLPDDWIEQIVNRLRNDPESEWAEIIRCKDCLFWQRDNISCEGYARCKTGEGGIRFRRENDFCSVARRRE